MSVNNFESTTINSELEHNSENVLNAIVKTCISENKINMWKDWMVAHEETFIEKGKEAHSEYFLEWSQPRSLGILVLGVGLPAS